MVVLSEAAIGFYFRRYLAEHFYFPFNKIADIMETVQDSNIFL